MTAFNVLDICENDPPRSEGYGTVVNYVNGKQVNGFMPSSLHGPVARALWGLGESK